MVSHTGASNFLSPNSNVQAGLAPGRYDIFQRFSCFPDPVSKFSVRHFVLHPMTHRMAINRQNIITSSKMNVDQDGRTASATFTARASAMIPRTAHF